MIPLQRKLYQRGRRILAQGEADDVEADTSEWDEAILGPSCDSLEVGQAWTKMGEGALGGGEDMARGTKVQQHAHTRQYRRAEL